jgi:hypothetical protein
MPRPVTCGYAPRVIVRTSGIAGVRTADTCSGVTDGAAAATLAIAVAIESGPTNRRPTFSF